MFTRFLFVIPCYLLLLSSPSIASDEIEAYQLATAIHTHANNSSLPILAGSQPAKMCDNLAAASTDIGHCGHWLTENGEGTNQYSCYYEKQSDNGQACLSQPFGGGPYLLGLIDVVATCPAGYQFVKDTAFSYSNYSRKGFSPAFGDNSTIVKRVNGYSGGYCERCLDPYEWNEGTQRCEFSYPSNMLFDSSLGIVTEKQDMPIEPQCEEFAGNPINANTGEKVQQEQPDYVGSGEFPLVFSRLYKSQLSPYSNQNQSLARNVTMTVHIQPANYRERRKPRGGMLPMPTIIQRLRGI